ncbi:hypothetical protein SY88_14180 [Clostridiales bacterium PH28_bin88]|nr:hypothetical protein SY88_14180 [Clostridiales bacterium PH28_bin88]
MSVTNLEKRATGGRKGLAILGLVLAVGLGVWGWYNFAPKGDVRRGVVEGSGSIEGTEVVVSSQIPGQIVGMMVQEGQRLAKGDLVARIGSEELAARVAQARARVEAAGRQVEQARAAVEGMRIKSEQASLAVDLADRQSAGQVDQAEAAVRAAEANLKQAEAALGKATDDYERFQSLYRDGAAPESQFKAVESGYQVAVAQYEAAQKMLEQARAALKLAETGELNAGIQRKEAAGVQAYLSQAEATLQAALAQEETARAVLAEAEAFLAKATISAPLSGTVINKLVEQGELVAPGTPLVRLVDLDDLKLTVYVPGQDLGRVKLGQTARVFIDSYPDRPIEGKVTFISQEAEFTPKNVHMRDERAKMVYAVKISLANPEGLLKPGMPANAEILVEEGL